MTFSIPSINSIQIKVWKSESHSVMSDSLQPLGGRQPGCLLCRQILYLLIHQGNPKLNDPIIQKAYLLVTEQSLEIIPFGTSLVV